MTYKGFYLWYNNVQRAWLVQEGYTIIFTSPSVGAAKAFITRTINNP